MCFSIRCASTHSGARSQRCGKCPARTMRSIARTSTDGCRGREPGDQGDLIRNQVNRSDGASEKSRLELFVSLAGLANKGFKFRFVAKIR
jgi:hypothetical protein